MQRPGDVGALQPGDEQAGAAADARAVGDPGVEQVLAQVGQLELLGVQPAGELDRLFDQRARVLLRETVGRPAWLVRASWWATCQVA